MRIWVCDMREIGIGDCFGEILQLFGAKKREEILRFKQEEGRHTALVREVMLSGIFADIFPDRRICIGKSEHGKPFVCGMRQRDGTVCGEEEYRDFSFSISHSGALVILACGFAPLGVDVEVTGRVQEPLKLIRFFSLKEQRWILDAPDPEREFYRVWTFREAFSKEEGVGLPLFEREKVDIDYERREVCFHGRRFLFYEYSVTAKQPQHSHDEYQITLCAGEKAPAPEICFADRKIFDRWRASVSESD